MEAVRRAVESAASRCAPRDVALSGGLDSSIVAWCARGRGPVGYTLDACGAPDAGFAKEAAEHLGIAPPHGQGRRGRRSARGGPDGGGAAQL